MRKNDNKRLEEVRKLVVPVLRRHGVVRAGIFGSYARGEAGKRSDVDILVKFSGKKSLFDEERCGSLPEAYNGKHRKDRGLAA